MSDPELQLYPVTDGDVHDVARDPAEPDDSDHEIRQTTSCSQVGESTPKLVADNRPKFRVGLLGRFTHLEERARSERELHVIPGT